MYKDFAKCRLFQGLTDLQLKSAVESLSPREEEYSKGDFILLQGSRPKGLGILLEGNAIVACEDFWGNRSVITPLESGDIFAETFAIAGLDEMPVSVISTGESRAAFLSRELLLNSGENLIPMIQQRLTMILAQKNMALFNRLNIISQSSLREKILSYLSYAGNGEDKFEISMKRQELADYLLVNRCVLSTELSKMRREGLIEFHKNKFKLKR